MYVPFYADLWHFTEVMPAAAQLLGNSACFVPVALEMWPVC